jgi:arginase
MIDRVYHLFGVPLRTGSLMPGSENDAQPYRDAGLIDRLQAAGCRVVDDGNVALPSYLPHHSIPPIRSWPGPRIAWELVGDRIQPILAQRGHVPLLIGCDCSIVVATTQALMRATSGDGDGADRDADADDVHVIYVDGDFDDAAPRADQCQSAAAMALWLAMHGEPFRAGPGLKPSNVSVIGWTNGSATSTGAAAGANRGAHSGDGENSGMRSYSLADIRRAGARATAQRALDAIPKSASIVLHFDIDVFKQSELPAAYFPHVDGLTLAEGTDLLAAILQDPRIRIIEITEYASLRDLDQRCVTQLVDLLVRGLQRT